MRRGSAAWKAAGITKEYQAWRQEWKALKAAARRQETLRRTINGLAPFTDAFRRAGATLKAFNRAAEKWKSTERGKSSK
jgi:hypothetical protein